MLRNDKIVGEFLDGPVSDLLKINDVCIYKPGDLNKIGKEGKTSWDSFSYALQMAHNVWAHINAVQLGNEEYDRQIIPNMLVEERFEQKFFRDVVEQIFSTSDRAVADAAVEEHNRFYMNIVGTRGFTGWRALNSHTTFNEIFSLPDASESIIEIEGCKLDQNKMDKLEENND